MASKAQRARIVLLAADGVGNQANANLVGVSHPTVNPWRGRYGAHGLKGLTDEARPGHPRTVDRSEVIAATLGPPPPSLEDPSTRVVSRGGPGGAEVLPGGG